MKRPMILIGTLMMAGTLILASCARKVTVADLLSDNPVEQTSALKRVKKLSDAKKGPLVPGLLSALHDADSQVIDRAVAALKAVGPAGYPQLKSALEDTDIYTRLCALDVIATYEGPARKLALPEVIKTLEDPHPLVREETAFALGKMGPEAALAVPALAKLHTDENADVKAAADEALQKIGTPEAKKVLETPAPKKRLPTKSKSTKSK